MPITKVIFKDFKNLNGTYTIKPRINLLIHPNGWGKTNFLEGIDYISTLKSFRNTSDRDLLKWEEETQFAQISLEINKDEYKKLSVVLSEVDERFTKKVFINDASTNSKKFKYQIRTILYSPHTADVVSSDPETRRTQFDRILSQIYSDYDDKLREYRFVVKSKNKLLQSIKTGDSKKMELEYWNQRLFELGTFILESRIEFLEETRELYLATASNVLDGRFEEAHIEYLSKTVEDGEVMLKEKVEKNIDKEIAASMSLYGPHRDDYSFCLGQNSLRDFGSRGQQRLAGIALVLTLYHYLLDTKDIQLILLLDDIMSELDAQHRKNIEDTLSEIDTQIFLTSSEERYFTEKFIKQANLL